MRTREGSGHVTSPYLLSSSFKLSKQFIFWFAILFLFFHLGHFFLYLHLQGQGLLIKMIIPRAYPRAWHRKHFHIYLLTAKIWSIIIRRVKWGGWIVCLNSISSFREASLSNAIIILLASKYSVPPQPQGRETFKSLLSLSDIPGQVNMCDLSQANQGFPQTFC